jgi:hypothetical protein
MASTMAPGGGSNGLRRRLGEMLVDEGILTSEMLQRALSAQMRSGAGVKLGGILVGSGVVPEAVLLETLARIHRCPWVGWEELSAADPATVRLVPEKRAFKLAAFAYALDKKTLKVAFADPSNLAALDEVASLTKCRVVPAVASEARLMQAHEKFYGRPLSQTFGNLLSRINRPRRAAAAAEPAKPPVPPPPPRFGGPDPDAPAPSLETVSAFLPDETGADPFSDGYPLAEFVADALAFGVPAREIFEARRSSAAAHPAAAHPSARGEEEPETLGDPLASPDDDDTTRSGRRKPPSDAEKAAG